MINYSISLRANPSDQDAPKKAYANAQYSEIMTLDKFAEHISTHGSKYNRADIQAVLIQAVDCMREQLLAGQRIQMGDLGTFSIHINSMGAESLVNTQFRAYPFYKASEWMPHKKLLLNSIVF